MPGPRVPDQVIRLSCTSPLWPSPTAKPANVIVLTSPLLFPIVTLPLLWYTPQLGPPASTAPPPSGMISSMASKNGDQVANAGTLFRWPPSGFPTEAPIMAGLCRAAIVAAFNPFRSPTPS